MFKRDQYEPETSSERRPAEPEPVSRPAARPAGGGPAVIGPSINVDGKLKGDEDLIIEGKVKGTVELKNNSVTIGSQGDVQADIFAHTIYVDGRMDGNLVASEQVIIRKSARVKGNVTSPRVSLEDGAQFNGSIDMDSQSPALSGPSSGQKRADQAPGGGARPGSAAPGKEASH